MTQDLQKIIENKILKLYNEVVKVVENPEDDGDYKDFPKTPAGMQFLLYKKYYSDRVKLEDSPKDQFEEFMKPGLTDAFVKLFSRKENEELPLATLPMIFDNHEDNNESFVTILENDNLSTYIVKDNNKTNIINYNLYTSEKKINDYIKTCKFSTKDKSNCTEFNDITNFIKFLNNTSHKIDHISYFFNYVLELPFVIEKHDKYTHLEHYKQYQRIENKKDDSAGVTTYYIDKIVTNNVIGPKEYETLVDDINKLIDYINDITKKHPYKIFKSNNPVINNKEVKYAPLPYYVKNNLVGAGLPKSNTFDNYLSEINNILSSRGKKLGSNSINKILTFKTSVDELSKERENINILYNMLLNIKPYLDSNNEKISNYLLKNLATEFEKKVEEINKKAETLNKTVEDKVNKSLECNLLNIISEMLKLSIPITIVQ